MILRKDQEIDEIQHHFNEISEKISHQENAVIIIGDTGEGKTTLLGYLTGIPLFSGEDDLGDYIIYAEDSNEIDINDRPISQTSLPKCREVYWDCPGFGDTRGPVQNIVNAYSIYKLVKNIEKLKILLVVSESIIRSTRKKEFLNLINNLGETFKDTEELVRGLCLVITKSNKLDVRKVRNCFRKILEEYDNQESFSQPKREILNFLSSSESQIVFFNAPDQEGQISDTDKFSILESIGKISYLTNLEPSVLLDDKSKLYINELVEKFYDDIKDYILLKFYPEIQNYYKTLIDTHRGTAKELRNSLIDFSNKFKTIHDIPEKFEENLQQILLIIEHIQNNDLKKELLKKISLLNFFKLVKPESFEIKGNTSSWYNYIPKLINELKILTTLNIYGHGQFLTFEGIIIGTEDLIPAMNNQELSEINVISLNSLFIDQDINAPGINLTLISPKWHVVGKKLINLKGISGFSHKPNKANDGITSTERQDTNGEDGLPGLPGYCGGNFYDGDNFGEKFLIKKEDMELISREKVKVFSSNEEKDQILDKVVRCAEKCAKFVVTFNDKHEETYEYFNPGLEGGNAGRGGIGGFGGKPGTILLDSSSKLFETPIIFKESKRGANGKGGKPGLGGKNGPKYRGVYINERVFPALRGIKEIDAKKCDVADGLLESTRATVAPAATLSITGLAASPLAFSVPAALAGFGITLAVQTSCSVVSANLSSGWKEVPHKVINEKFSERAPEGNLPDGLNEAKIIKTNFDRLPSIKTEEKE
ncbi:8253_t:CDS:2, partial [Racocetra persica]